GAQVEYAPRENGRACSKEGWCWVYPVPHANGLFATWGSAGTDFWTGGDRGYLSHWNGQRFDSFRSDYRVFGIWGHDAQDIWAVGDAILHWDGSSWSTLREAWPVLRAVTGRDASHAWAVGLDGEMQRWDGVSWNQVDSGTSMNLLGVWASSEQDLWIVGDASTGRHWDGVKWTDYSDELVDPRYPFTRLPFFTIWGSAPDDVYTVGQLGTFHWNGQSWTKVFDAVFDPYSVWGSGRDDVWIAGGRLDNFRQLVLHRVNGNWGGVYFDYRMTNVLGIGGGKDAVWFVGDEGDVVVNEQGNFRELSPGGAHYQSIWASSPNDAWLVGYRNLRNYLGHWDGTAVQLIPTRILRDLWGSSSDDVWAVGTEIRHWDGATWTVVRVFDPGQGTLTAIDGSAPDDIWAVGERLALHWNGLTWSEDRLPIAVASLWAGAEDDV